jgi:RimJ/RimL family protein N-acetyltransferase
MIQDVTDSDLERVRAYLEAHMDSSLFLLSNLALCGPRRSEEPGSGNYRCAVEEGTIVAVFSLTRRGNLLVQAAGRADLAAQILEACEAEPIEITGVVGDWPTAEALWALVCADPRFEPTVSIKDVLFSLSLTDATKSTQLFEARALSVDDFDRWAPLNAAYLAELNLPLQLTPEQRREEFESRARAHRWWGAFEGDRLVAIAGLNAVYGHLGQVGGVYSPPEDRRKGFARAVMGQLICDSRTRHHFERLVLFTGENNIGARRLYESLGFQAAGSFALFLGTRHTAPAPTQQRYKWAGQSGEIYTYEVHEWPTRLSPGPGNFIFASSDGGGGWLPVLMGEAADLSELAAQERMRGTRHEATHVHVRLNFNPVGVRRREAADLIARWLPGHSGGQSGYSE